MCARARAPVLTLRAVDGGRRAWATMCGWGPARSQLVTAQIADDALAADPAITHVCVIHCETTTGILNPIEEVRGELLHCAAPRCRADHALHGATRAATPHRTQIAAVVQKHGKRYIVDAMSSLGALPISAKTMYFDAVVSSANKCLEGVPGCAFSVVRRTALEASAGNAHSLALDLHDQWRNFEATGCVAVRTPEPPSSAGGAPSLGPALTPLFSRPRSCMRRADGAVLAWPGSGASRRRCR